MPIPTHGHARIHFGEFWKSHIRAAVDSGAVLSVVRVYLAAWSPEQLAALPTDLGATALTGADALMARAVIASRAELEMPRDDPTHPLLEEMSLTLTAAADRIRALTPHRPMELATLRDVISRID